MAIDQTTMRANWRCFLACGIMLVTPFQYGIDFGLIGGLQAMPGFLKVRKALSQYSKIVPTGSQLYSQACVEQVYGYEAPNTAIGWNITPVRQQLISSLMTLGAFVSSGMWSSPSLEAVCALVLTE